LVDWLACEHSVTGSRLSPPHGLAYEFSLFSASGGILGYQLNEDFIGPYIWNRQKCGITIFWLRKILGSMPLAIADEALCC
jgi:hypothetical protein